MITREKLIETVAETTRLPKETVNTILTETTNRIGMYLVTGEKVKLYGFGTFEPIEWKARKCVNPRTGEKMDVPSHMRVKFKPSDTLLEALNE